MSHYDMSRVVEAAEKPKSKEHNMIRVGKKASINIRCPLPKQDVMNLANFAFLLIFAIVEVEYFFTMILS